MVRLVLGGVLEDAAAVAEQEIQDCLSDRVERLVDAGQADSPSNRSVVEADHGDMRTARFADRHQRSERQGVTDADERFDIGARRENALYGCPCIRYTLLRHQLRRRIDPELGAGVEPAEPAVITGA